MKPQTMIRGMLLIGLATIVALWLVTALHTCSRETLGEVEARTGEISRLVASAVRAIQGVLGGGVTINSHGVIAVPKEIAELAVLEHEVSVTTNLTRTRWFGWFPSTLSITGNFRPSCHHSSLPCRKLRMAGRRRANGSEERLRIPKRMN